MQKWLLMVQKCLTVALPMQRECSAMEKTIIPYAPCACTSRPVAVRVHNLV
jgi:hypothetical protein